MDVDSYDTTVAELQWAMVSFLPSTRIPLSRTALPSPCVILECFPLTMATWPKLGTESVKKLDI